MDQKCLLLIVLVTAQLFCKCHGAPRFRLSNGRNCGLETQIKDLRRLPKYFQDFRLIECYVLTRKEDRERYSKLVKDYSKLVKGEKMDQTIDDSCKVDGFKGSYTWSQKSARIPQI